MNHVLVMIIASRARYYEWNKSQARSQSLINSARFSALLMLAFQSSSSPGWPRDANVARFGSERLYAEGGLPLSASYSSLPRRLPFIDCVRTKTSGRV